MNETLKPKEKTYCDSCKENTETAYGYSPNSTYIRNVCVNCWKEKKGE